MWGNESHGQLGLGSNFGQVHVNPKLCSFNIKITKVRCGEEHSALIADSGHLYMMGSNQDGQLGIENNRFNPTDTSNSNPDMPSI